MLDPKEEARFDKLKSMCRKLKVPAPPEIMIGLQVHDRDGVLVFDDVQRGHSWTRNYWNFLFALAVGYRSDGNALFGAGKMTAKDINGTVANNTSFAVQTGTALANLPLYGGVAGVSGIRCGTGDTAFSVDQINLVAPIAEGTGAGQFSHQASNLTSSGYTAGSKTWKMTLSRIFNNNSGSSITVKETGLMTQNASAAITFFANAGTFLFERSVLDPTVAVANAAQLTVTYEVTMDFSAID